MYDRSERVKKIQESEFYLEFFEGTYMPNNRSYLKVTMFEDVFYVEDEKEEKEYKHTNIILKMKDMIEKNLSNIEEIMFEQGPSIKASYRDCFNLKINNKTYSINKYTCNEKGQKLYNDFKAKFYEILDIKNLSNNNDDIIAHLNNWKENRNVENFKIMLEHVKNYVFYCPVKINNNKEEIAMIKNSRGESLLTAFSSMVELKKWIKDDEIKVARVNFERYYNIMASEDIKTDGVVIDPFGVNVVFPEKIIKDIFRK